MVAEPEWRKQIPLDRSRGDINRVLPRFGKIVNWRAGEEVVVTVFQERAGAVQLQGQHKNRREPPDAIAPPIQIPGKERQHAELHANEWKKLQKDLRPRR